MTENDVTGKAYRILKDKGNNIWDRVSFWTHSTDVEMESGMNLEKELSELKEDLNTTIANQLTPLITSVNSKIGQHDSALLNKIYPIGAIYISVSSTSPQTLFGGTWEQLQNRMLMAAGSSYSAGSTGGSATINLQHYHTVNNHNHTVDSHNHTTSGHALTISEMPSHDHSFDQFYRAGDSSMDSTSGYNIPYGTGKSTGTRREYTYSEGGGQSHSHGNTGYASPSTSYSSPNTNSQLSTAQSVLPPYLTVYMWKRTA